jgi:hypothetical protein
LSAKSDQGFFLLNEYKNSMQETSGFRAKMKKVLIHEAGVGYQLTKLWVLFSFGTRGAEVDNSAAINLLPLQHFLMSSLKSLKTFECFKLPSIEEATTRT